MQNGIYIKKFKIVRGANNIVSIDNLLIKKNQSLISVIYQSNEDQFKVTMNQAIYGNITNIEISKEPKSNKYYQEIINESRCTKKDLKVIAGSLRNRSWNRYDLLLKEYRGIAKKNYITKNEANLFIAELKKFQEQFPKSYQDDITDLYQKIAELRRKSRDWEEKRETKIGTVEEIIQKCLTENMAHSSEKTHTEKNQSSVEKIIQECLSA